MLKPVRSEIEIFFRRGLVTDLQCLLHACPPARYRQRMTCGHLEDGSQNLAGPLCLLDSIPKKYIRPSAVRKCFNDLPTEALTV